MIGAITLGRTSMNMMRRSPAPSERAASTYSRSLTESTCPRTMRAIEAQLKKPITTIVTSRLGPVMDTSAIGHQQERDREDHVDQAGEDQCRPRHRRSPAARPTTTPTITVSMVASTPTPQRDASAVGHPGQHVTAQVVRAEPEGRARPTGRPSGVRPVSRYCTFGRVAGEPGEERREDRDQHQQARSPPARPIATLSFRSRSQASLHGPRPSMVRGSVPGRRRCRSSSGRS